LAGRDHAPAEDRALLAGAVLAALPTLQGSPGAFALALAGASILGSPAIERVLDIGRRFLLASGGEAVAS